VDVLRAERGALLATGLAEVAVETILLTRMGCRAGGGVSCEEPSVVQAGRLELRPHESQRVRMLLGAIDQVLAMPSADGSSTSSAFVVASSLAPESVCKILDSFAARVAHPPAQLPAPEQPTHAPPYLAPDFLTFKHEPPKKNTSSMLRGDETSSSSPSISPSPSPSAKRSKLRDTRPV
jgi:hypothetical protein